MVYEIVLNFCNENDLWLIEDYCDALGAKFKNQFVGTFGKFGTFSFYPAHHITMGEGGAVITKKGTRQKSFRVYERLGKRLLVCSRTK